jgi:hypothetical protein
MERYFEISEALIKSGGVVWDNHNGGSEIKLHGLAALVHGDKVVTVGLLKADFFSLNRVFLQDDKVHLSVDSVGGTLFPVNFKDLWDCINDYNEKQANNKFSCGTLENVMSLIPVPVTVITMTVGEFNERVRITAEQLTVAEQLRESIAAGEEDETRSRSKNLDNETVMHRKVFGPVDFLPGDEDEIQEAYYREMLAKKQAGAEPTEDLGKDIPFVAGYAGHKDPTKL